VNPSTKPLSPLRGGLAGGLSDYTIPSHAGYIESWLKVLKNDKKAIFTAASQASKAHRYIMDRVEAMGEKIVA